MGKPEQLPNGSWRIRWTEEIGGKPVRRCRSGFDTCEQAQAALDAARHQRNQIRAGLARPLSNKTLAEVAAEWIEERPEARQRDDQSHLTHHIEPFFGDMPMPDVEKAIKKFVKELERKTTARPGQKEGTPLSTGTIERICATLRKLMRDSGYAIKIEHKSQQPDAKPVSTDPGDVQRYLDACSPAWFKVAAALGCYGGLRKGEVAGLQRSDIDFEHGTIHLLRTYDGAPLKGKKIRYVSLSPELASILRAWFKRSAGPLVVTIDGRPITESTDMATRSRKACRRAGLESVPFHSTRHTYGTHQALANSPAKVMAAMGHTSMATTMRYVHMSPESLARDPGMHLSFAPANGRTKKQRKSGRGRRKRA